MAAFQDGPAAGHGLSSATSSGSCLPACAGGLELGVHQLVGSGDYEGLSALLFWTEEPGARWPVTGIVFPGGLPPAR